ncbi:MAG TPA: deoxyguanosinetriphosphate triphosphohydrolase [Chloroflexia bacterium]|nr:deoxyguanosinetriphosphate triphosphohydrolase [Chloroflexia bacterium]
MIQSSQVRERIEQDERDRLSPLAAKAGESRGRPRPEPPDSIRTAFQRDRDRIIHCKAFRRLKHKTQVFIAPMGDHYRTRLTHTLEVAQIGRTIARALRLNEDLVEAISLAHDLGHAPFGHAGEEAIREVFDPQYRHNDQSLRIVDYLAKDGDGLNLTYEVRLALPDSTPVSAGLAGEGGGQTTVEGKVQKISDSIAYINHDIDDAIRAGIITGADLPRTATAILGDSHSARINTMVCNLVAENWAVAYPPAGAPLPPPAHIQLHFTPAVLAAADELKTFLLHRVYIGSAAKGEQDRVHAVIHALYRHYCQHFDEIPAELARNPRDEPQERIVVDYIAGMTDRFAIEKFQELYVPKLWSI